MQLEAVKRLRSRVGFDCMSWTGSENNRKDQGECRPPVGKPIGTAQPYASRPNPVPKPIRQLPPPYIPKPKTTTKHKRQRKKRGYPLLRELQSEIGRAVTHAELDSVARKVMDSRSRGLLKSRDFKAIVNYGKWQRERLSAPPLSDAERLAMFMDLVDCQPHEVKDVPADRIGCAPESYRSL